MLLYWPHTSAVVACNGGTSVGHGPVRTLFLEFDFVPSAGTLNVGHGTVRTLFLGLILCVVPMTACETMLYWPQLSALVAYNGGTSIGHGPVRTLFLEADFVLSAGTLDVRHGPVRTLFLGLILCVVPMTRCESRLIGVLGALWTRRPIIKVAMGCRTEPAAVHIAHVLQKLHFFQFFSFFIIYTTHRKKKTRP